jgi:DNA repair photolyase
MIISASRRTDILAYYGDWLIERIKKGYCTVPNPMNPNQISFVNLKKENVDAIVFWTRNPKQFLNKLSIVDGYGYQYYFQYTVNNYPKKYEPYAPNIDSNLETFRTLSKIVGSNKIIWRYDPIILNNTIDINFHRKNLDFLFSNLNGYTNRLVISILDLYKKTIRRFNSINEQIPESADTIDRFYELLQLIGNKASEYNIEVQSCAESIDLSFFNVKHGKCIDDDLLKSEFGIKITYRKDKTQRKECGCIVSKDIGINNSCLMGCEYCYATQSHSLAIENHQKHDPSFSSIFLHELDAKTIEKIKRFENDYSSINEQHELFI